MSFQEDTKIFINIDMDIEEVLSDLIQFKIETLISDSFGIIEIQRERKFISKNEKKFQREFIIKKFSEFSGSEPGLSKKYYNM